MSNDQTRRPIVKIVLGIIATVFLGAIGSGLWERLLGPAADWVLRHLISASGSAAHVYLDHLYSDIGKGLREEASFLPAIFLVVLVVLFSIGGAILSLATLFRTTVLTEFLQTAILPPPDTARRHRRTWLILAMSTFNAAAYSDAFFVMSYQNKTVVWIERSIEIVRPQIPESRFLELRAMYRGVSDSQSFFQLWDDINAIADKSKLKLPKYKPYGRAP